MAKVQQEGKTLHDLLPDFLQQAINKLPIPKRMRWGDSKVQFVRPVHWLLVLFGDEVIPLSILELDASQHSRGHRFHSSSPVIVESPESYESQLNDAYVIADFAKRRDLIRSQVEAAGQEAGGEAVIDDALLDEVTALVEWPVPLVGHFDESFLRSEEHTSELQSRGHLVCRLLLEKKKISGDAVDSILKPPECELIRFGHWFIGECN